MRWHETRLPPGLRLRAANVDDAMELGFLELELFPDEAWTVFQIAEEIEHPDRAYVVVEELGPIGEPRPIVAYAGIMVIGDIADLHTIGTTRPGEGIGRVLLGWCEIAALKRGATQLFLEVREDNARARAVYARAGYEEIGRRPGYYRLPGGSVDAIVMRLEL